MITLATKRTYHHGNLREALVLAAMREVAQDGPEGFSLRGVARRAGVSAAAVYRHFRDKDDLLTAVAGECSERVAAAMTAAVAVGVAPADPLERFRAVGIAYVLFAVMNPEHFRAMSLVDLATRMPAAERARQDAWQAAQKAAIQDAQRIGSITDLPYDEVMLAASAITDGLAHQIVSGQLGEVNAKRAEELAIAVTRALGVGLIPRDETWIDPRDRVRVAGRKAAARHRGSM